jgi:hypothetical protein
LTTMLCPQFLSTILGSALSRLLRFPQTIKMVCRDNNSKSRTFANEICWVDRSRMSDLRDREKGYCWRAFQRASWRGFADSGSLARLLGFGRTRATTSSSSLGRGSYRWSALCCGISSREATPSPARPLGEGLEGDGVKLDDAAAIPTYALSTKGNVVGSLLPALHGGSRSGSGCITQLARHEAETKAKIAFRCFPARSFFELGSGFLARGPFVIDVRTIFVRTLPGQVNATIFPEIRQAGLNTQRRPRMLFAELEKPNIWRCARDIGRRRVRYRCGFFPPLRSLRATVTSVK